VAEREEGTTRLRAVVADSHHLARSGVVRTLERAGHRVLAEESDGDAALRAVAALDPDVLVVGLDLGGVDRGHVVAIARDRWPGLAIVAVSDDGAEDAQLLAWQLGSSAHLARSASPDDVLATVQRAVAAPTAFLGEDLLALRRARENGPRLTVREAEVLRLAAEGLSVAAISRRLFVADSTTKSHLSGIYRKLGVSTRSQAVLAAERWGMLR
jgi:DNA-binding NarL/FixJ family response regulator